MTVDRDELVEKCIEALEQMQIAAYGVDIPEMNKEDAANTVIDVVLASLLSEWGVRFPSGSVQVMKDEDEARRYAIVHTQLRLDMPVLVVRKVVGDWTLEDGAPIQEEES